VIEWSATAITILGAIATALAYDPLNIYLLNLGSVLWLIWAVRVRKLSLVIVNAALLIVYVYGMIVRI
jgi:apolipoprotein N-acyltransferase